MGFPGGANDNGPNCLPVQEMQKTGIQSLVGEDPLEEGMGAHSNYSCLENPMDRGACWATVHGVIKSQTQLK